MSLLNVWSAAESILSDPDSPLKDNGYILAGTRNEKGKATELKNDRGFPIRAFVAVTEGSFFANDFKELKDVAYALADFLNGNRKASYNFFYLDDPKWNLNSDNPMKLTDLLTPDSAISVLKLLYGEETREDSGIYELPDDWAKDNRDFLRTLLDSGMLTAAQKYDLGLQ